MGEALDGIGRVVGAVILIILLVMLLIAGGAGIVGGTVGTCDTNVKATNGYDYSQCSQQGFDFLYSLWGGTNDGPGR